MKKDKKLELYFTKGSHSTVFRVKPTEHKSLDLILSKNWGYITDRYRKIPPEDIKRGKIVDIRLKKEDFTILQQVLRTQSKSIVVFYQTTRKPIVSIGIQVIP